MQKPYWLFCGKNFYPAGGIKDLSQKFETVEAAREAYWHRYDEALDIGGGEADGFWGHILDIEQGLILVTFDEKHEFISIMTTEKFLGRHHIR